MFSLHQNPNTSGGKHHSSAILCAVLLCFNDADKQQNIPRIPANSTGVADGMRAMAVDVSTVNMFPFATAGVVAVAVEPKSETHCQSHDIHLP